MKSDCAVELLLAMSRGEWGGGEGGLWREWAADKWKKKKPSTNQSASPIAIAMQPMMGGAKQRYANGWDGRMGKEKQTMEDAALSDNEGNE